MKRLIGVLLFVAVYTFTANSQVAGKQPKVFIIREPTIIAFFAPITQGEADNGDAEALSDFNYYAYRVEKPLRNAGIEFHVAEERSRRTRNRTSKLA
jgi:hypothetical protein